MKRPMFVDVRGRSGESYSFEFRGDPAHLSDWRADGLEVYEIAASVPEWLAWCPAMNLYIGAQRLWQWLRVW
jgi:hypothetical protein